MHKKTLRHKNLTYDPITMIANYEGTEAKFRTGRRETKILELLLNGKGKRVRIRTLVESIAGDNPIKQALLKYPKIYTKEKLSVKHSFKNINKKLGLPAGKIRNTGEYYQLV